MKFVHFGCWNEHGCDNNITKYSSPLSYVMKSLRDNVSKYDFIIIAGDNYYPNKKTNNMELCNFISGFNCLPKNITKYLLFGNHEVEDIVSIDKIIKDEQFENTPSVINNSDKTPKKCLIIDNQLMYVKNNNYGNSFVVFDEVIYFIKEKFLIIMIDTTIYEYYSQKKNINIECYNRLFKKYNTTNVSKLINYQNCEIKNIIITQRY